VDVNPEWYLDRKKNILDGQDSLSVYFMGFPSLYDYAEVYNHENDEPQNLYDAHFILLHTNVYAGYHIGEAGTQSIQTKAYEMLMREPNTNEAMIDLVKRGGMAGKIYGLTYLLEWDYRYYQYMKQKYISKEDSVWTFFGCIQIEEPVIEILELYETW